MCLTPNYVKRYFDANTGEVKLKFMQFSEWNQEALKENFNDNYFTLPCNKCAECCEQYSNEWAWRVMCESKLYSDKDTCFITLTYDDKKVDDVSSLHPKHLQDFIKRLRKDIEPKKLRYFACGEYGSKGLRPHYHMILFGYRPDDLKFLRVTKKKQIIYTSSSLEKCWSFGFVSVGNISAFSAKYCAGYMQKLNNLPDGAIQPFTRMSLKPGIGYDYFVKNKDELLKSDAIWFNGTYQHIPRYFLRKCDPNEIVELKEFRKVKAKLLYDKVNHKYDNLEVMRV